MQEPDARNNGTRPEIQQDPQGDQDWRIEDPSLRVARNLEISGVLFAYLSELDRVHAEGGARWRGPAEVCERGNVMKRHRGIGPWGVFRFGGKGGEIGSSIFETDP